MMVSINEMLNIKKYSAAYLYTWPSLCKTQILDCNGLQQFDSSEALQDIIADTRVEMGIFQSITIHTYTYNSLFSTSSEKNYH